MFQHKLEGGLLALGQFQHALDELLAWMSHTEELLGEQRKAGGDPKAIEIELAKHHVSPRAPAPATASQACRETPTRHGNHHGSFRNIALDANKSHTALWLASRFLKTISLKDHQLISKWTAHNACLQD